MTEEASERRGSGGPIDTEEGYKQRARVAYDAGVYCLE